MSSVTLIHPGAAQEIYQGLSNELTAVETPIWTRMIAGWLIDHGHQVKIIDQEAENLSNKQVRLLLTKQTPDLAAIVAVGHQPSGSTQQMTPVRALAHELHDFKTILIGHHVSALPVQTLSEEPVDYVCDGEGPLTIDGLLRNMKLENIPGLVWNNKNTIVQNPLAPLIPIDELHGDVWNSLPMNLYRAHTWQCLDGSPRSPYASIYTTLGCPFKCSFCMINVFQHSNLYRRRTPSEVVNQISMLYRDYGVRTFKISDEMFVLDPSHYIPICQGLASLPFHEELNLWAYARIDTVNTEMLNLMRLAGIRWLALGIEAGSSYVRDGAEKHLDDQDIEDIVKAIQKSGINVIGNFIFGLPDDTKESMQQTLDLSIKLKCEFVNYYCAMAYPGSKLYDGADQSVLPKHWSGYSQHSLDTTPLPTKTLSSKDIVEFRDMAFTEYFTNPDYLEMIHRKFGSFGVQQISDMTKYRLQRVA